MIGESKRFISNEEVCQLYINDTLERQRERMVIMITNEKVMCKNCGEEIEKVQGFEYQDGYLCECCYYDEFFICENCGSLTKHSECKVINPHLESRMYVCPDCADRYQVCSHCDSLITQSEVWASDHELTICNNCSSFYTICNECDCIVDEDDAYYSNGLDYCHDCYTDRYSDCIEDYSYKPDPVFLGETDENLYLGVELEVDYGNNLQSTTKRIYDEFGDVYMKHDGSLSNSGFEIVSHPATIEYHASELGWKELMDVCLENGYRSHDTTTCGLHIHLSRAFLGETEQEQELNIAKLIILFDRFWDSHLVPFSRRDYSALHDWADKPSVECSDSDTETEVVDKIKQYKHSGRYKAINLQNYSTIEFRLFRGTLKFSTFLASLQFVVTITRFVKSIKLNQIFTVTWEDLFLCTEYQELKEYLVKKNLLKGEN